MPLSRLENFLKNAAGNILYVDPTSFDASDAYDNQGNSLTRPFVSIQRALIEAARFSYQVGRNNDKIDRTTILVYPGIHYVDNRPGFAVQSTDGQTATYSQKTGKTTWTSTSLNELNVNTNFNILDPTNDLYKFNSVNGGVILPRGTSIIGLDLRKTKIRPLFVPDPQSDDVDNSSIFNVTGTCYFSTFSFFDADPTKVAYKDYTNTQYIPNFSHHKLVAFAYADGVNKVALGYNQTTLTDLDMYYYKVAKFYGDVTGRSISDYPQTIDFEPSTDEFKIVGSVQTNPLGISSIFAGNGVIPSNIITVTTKDFTTGLPANHGLNVDSPVLVSGVTIDPNSYNGSFTVREVVGLTTFTYASVSTPVNPIPINVDPTALDVASTIVESDTVNSASPYIFGCSLRSVYGMCGMWADGSKADGFKSMVVAQFTGVSLQKDENAFILYRNGTYYDNTTLAANSTQRPLHTNSYSIYKPSYENFHVRCSNNSFIQCVSIFAIGFAKHFVTESGGDMSITNSNSNFGAVSLDSSGFRSQSFDRDDTGYITHIIPPKELDTNESNITWLSLDGDNIRLTSDNKKIYIYGNSDSANPPSYQVSGYRIGAKNNDLLYLTISSGIAQTTYSSPILMQVPSGISTSSSKIVNVGRSSGINSITSNIFTLTSNHKLFNGENVRVFSDTGQLPDGIFVDTIYYAITTGLSANQIQLASSINDAQNSNPITGISNGGGILSIVSRVSDKVPGDYGHPIQFDTSVNRWYILSDSNLTSNKITSAIISNNINTKTNNAFIKRKIDTRSVEDRIYRIRYAIPKNYLNARPPQPGFVLEESKTVGVTSFSYTTASVVSPVNLRNEKVIVNAISGSISNNSQVITLTTEIPHNFIVGDVVKVQNIASGNNLSAIGITSTYNGSYTVQSVPSSRTFTYAISGVSTNPGLFANAINLRTTSSQLVSLPTVSRQEYLNKFYIYKVNTIRKYVYGKTDGVYELIVLSSVANIPTNVGYGLSARYFNQDVRNLYPQIDRDNFDSDPVATISSSDVQKIGKVITNDKKKSLTKETIDLITKNTKIGFGITGVSLSGTANTTITLYTNVEHKLNSIKSLTVPTTGSGYAISSSYYSQDLIDVSLDENATCRFTTDATGKIQTSTLQIVDPGSAYTVGTALTISGGLSVASVLGITTISEINDNINDGLEISGFNQLELNGIHKILSVPNSKTVVIQHGTGISTYIANTNSSTPIAYVASKGVGITSFAFPDVTTGIVTVTTSGPHGLLQGNKFTTYETGSTILNGTYIVKSVVGLTTFNFNVGIANTVASSTTGILFKRGFTSNGLNIGLSEENLGYRGSYIYAGLTTTISAGLGTADTTITFTSANGLKRGDYIQLDSEIIRLASVPSGNVFSILRSQLGTYPTTATNGSVIKKIKVLPVELRRPSFIRASGHTFEYLGYGPGNYSTTLPQKQNRVLDEDEVKNAQVRKTSAGLIVYNGLNDLGENYTGAKKTLYTGEDKIIEAPIVTFTGDDAQSITSNYVTGVFDEVLVKQRLTVEGGDNNNQTSLFYGPVNFSRKITSTSDDGIESINLTLKGSTDPKLFTVDISTPTTTSLSAGSISFISNPTNDYIGNVYVENQWRSFGPISKTAGKLNFYFDKLGIGIDNSSDTTYDFTVANGTKLKDLKVTGAVVFDQTQSLGTVNFVDIYSTNLFITGISTIGSTLLVGSATSTGTENQALQIGNSGSIKGAYISGNLGIGSTNPTQKLDINGNINLVSSGNYIQKTFADNTEEYILRGPSLTSYYPTITYTRSTGTSTRGFKFGTHDNVGNRSDWMTIWNGSVGIGSTLPSSTLDVNGTAKVKGDLTVSNGDLYITRTDAIGGDIIVNGGTDGIFGIFNSTNSGSITLNTKNSGGTYINVLNLNSSRAFVNAKLGIGIDNPDRTITAYTNTTGKATLGNNIRITQEGTGDAVVSWDSTYNNVNQRWYAGFDTQDSYAWKLAHPETTTAYGSEAFGTVNGAVPSQNETKLKVDTNGNVSILGSLLGTLGNLSIGSANYTTTINSTLTVGGGNLNISGDNSTLYGPNTTWSQSLRVGGNGNADTTNPSIVTTNGNLHLDAKTGAFATYINYYKGTEGIKFGSGSSTIIGSIDSSGNSTFRTITSSVAQGTAPFQVTSTTQVSNLNVSQLEGFTTDTANTANRIVRRDGSGNFSAGTITASLSGSVTGGTISGTTGTFSSGLNVTSGTTTLSGAFTANGGVNNIYNPNGNSYNEGIRIPRATNNYSSLCLASDTSGSGSILGQYNFVVYPGNIQQGIFAIRANGTDALTINNAGNATIINGTLTATSIVKSGGNSSQFLKADGSVDSGTPPGGSNGNVQYNNGSSFAGSNNLTFDGTNLSCGGDITAFASDERLKTNIEPIENALDKVLALNGFIYNFNEIGKELGFDTSIRHAGVSAQEVQAVLPEVVAPAPVNDKYITVKYEKLVPLLIEAIKELKEEINELKGGK